MNFNFRTLINISNQLVIKKKNGHIKIQIVQPF